MGCVGDGQNLLDGWQRAGQFRARLNGLSSLDGDKKGAIATFLSVLERERQVGDEHLSLLVAAWDEAGVAVSGFGFTSIVSTNHPGAAEVWLDGEHPLLSLPGWPSHSLGALVVPTIPEWLIGVIEPDDVMWRSALSRDLLRASGVNV